MSVLPEIFLPFLGELSAQHVTFPEPDIGLAGIFLGKYLREIGAIGTLTVLIGIVIIMILIPEMIENREEGEEWFQYDMNPALKQKDKKKK